MTGAPTATGHRLALIVGHSLPAGHFTSGPGRVLHVEVDDSPTVTVLDHDGVVVLFRHGHLAGSFTPAHLVDHRAHVRALCAAGVGRVLALSSVGSLRADWPVGTVVAPDDFLALGATESFHETAEGHRVPSVDPGWRRQVVDAWSQHADVPLVDGGVYAQTRGPRFETPAEVRFLAHHADVVSMTAASECFLAGEAGLAYAVVAVVDNLANGLGPAPVTMDDVRAGKAANEATVAAAVDAVLPALVEP